MSEPTIAQKSPIPVEVEAGKDHWWRSCGMSKRQPFCDGSHKGSPFTPAASTPRPRCSATAATRPSEPLPRGVTSRGRAANSRSPARSAQCLSF